MEALLVKKMIKVFIAIHLMAQTFTLSCNLRLSNNNWLNDWHLLLTHDGNNRYELVRTQNVAANKEILVMCNNEHRPSNVRCNNNQRFSQTLPLGEPCLRTDSLIPVRIADQASYCRYTLYRIGFNVQLSGRLQFLETYQVCFDHRHMRPIFTINKAYPLAGRRPQIQFNADDIFYGRLFSAFSRRESFKRFKQLLGPSQSYMDESNADHIIDRGHLTPSADFALTKLKDATFNMINVIPQFKTIDNSNWRLIEEWARQPNLTPTNVCNGILDCNLDLQNPADLHCVVTLKDDKGKLVPIFLADNRKIPIPLWTYKIVKSHRYSLVFLTLNNIYHKGNVDVPHRVCREIECPLSLSKTVKEGRTFCCDYSDFINRNVPHLTHVC